MSRKRGALWLTVLAAIIAVVIGGTAAKTLLSADRARGPGRTHPAISPATQAAGRPVTPSGRPELRLPGATRTDIPPPVVNNGPRTGNRVALTFDSNMTEGMLEKLRTGQVRSYANLRVIDVLEHERVPATFFLSGKWVERYPSVTRRLAANPRFELANHSYAHTAFTANCYGLASMPVTEMADDVAKAFRVLRPYGGRQTRYFRFPGLCRDAAAVAALAPLGLTVVDGDVPSSDAFAMAWQPIVKKVLTNVRPGSIIILHITEGNAEMTDEALPHILAGLHERGLVPARLSEVLAPG